MNKYEKRLVQIKEVHMHYQFSDLKVNVVEHSVVAFYYVTGEDHY